MHAGHLFQCRGVNSRYLETSMIALTCSENSKRKLIAIVDTSAKDINMYSVFALLSSEVDSKNNIKQTLKCLLINYSQSLNTGLHIANSFSADFFSPSKHTDHACYLLGSTQNGRNRICFAY